jgi:hypothetical protein
VLTMKSIYPETSKNRGIVQVPSVEKVHGGQPCTQEYTFNDTCERGKENSCHEAGEPVKHATTKCILGVRKPYRAGTPIGHYI